MRKLLFIIIPLIIINQACTINYSLSGASIAPGVKTVSVQHFVNRASGGVANLEQYFTDELKDRFKSQTSLTVVNDEGNLNFEGEITKYFLKPMAITGSEDAAQNRLNHILQFQ